MRLALAQVVTGYEAEDNLKIVAEQARKAADAGADLVQFPEATMRAFGYPLTDVAEPLDGPWANGVRKVAEDTGIVVVAGMFEPGRDSSGGRDGERQRVRNTLIATGRGVDTSYTKIHLFDAFGFAESDTVEPGEEPITFDLAGTTVGLTICYDLRFPKLYAESARAGASVILASASWGAGKGKVAQWDLLARARALDSTSFVSACGQADPSTIGVELRGAAPIGVGHSLVAGPTGETIDSLGAEPGLLVVDIDPTEVDGVRAKIPVLQNARLGY